MSKSDLSPEQHQARRESYLRRTYGITQEIYDKILEDQGGGCALCGKTPSDEGLKLAVDHDHKTGAVRGILCRYCNHRVVGRHRDGNLLRKMADYVERDTGYKAPEKPKRRSKRARKVKTIG